MNLYHPFRERCILFHVIVNDVLQHTDALFTTHCCWHDCSQFHNLFPKKWAFFPPDEIENVKGYFNVNNSVLMDEIYYTSSSSVSIKLNGTITLKNGTSITPDDNNIKCYRDSNNKNNTFKKVENNKKGN